MATRYDDDDMNDPQVRERTFTNWKLQRPSAADMAGAGFIYKGPSDRVECYGCGIQLAGWHEHMNARHRHAASTEVCPVVESFSPLGPGSGSSRSSTSSRLLGSNDSGIIQDFRSQSSVTTTATASAAAAPSIAAYADPDTDFTDGPASYESALSVHSIPPASSRTHLWRAAPTRYCKLETRLQSFEGVSWPRDLAVQPQNLAKAGMYYVGPVDRVKCGYCGGMLKNWLSHVSAIDVHVKYFPRCAFVLLIEKQTAELSKNIRSQDKKDICVSSTELKRQMREETERCKQSTPVELARKTLLRLQYNSTQIRRAERRLRQQGKPLELVYLMKDLQLQEQESFAGSSTHDSSDSDGSDLEDDGEQEDPDMSESSYQSAEESICKLELELRSVSREMDELSAQTTCKVCLVNPVDTLFLTCRHLITCKACADRVRDCPVCRLTILGTVDVFMD